MLTRQVSIRHGVSGFMLRRRFQVIIGFIGLVLSTSIMLECANWLIGRATRCFHWSWIDLLSRSALGWSQTEECIVEQLNSWTVVHIIRNTCIQKTVLTFSWQAWMAKEPAKKKTLAVSNRQSCLHPFNRIISSKYNTCTATSAASRWAKLMVKWLVHGWLGHTGSRGIVCWRFCGADIECSRYGKRNEERVVFQLAFCFSSIVYRFAAGLVRCS